MWLDWFFVGEDIRQAMFKYARQHPEVISNVRIIRSRRAR
jgi:hypothetical protein